MKRIFLYLFLFSSSFAGKSQVVASSCLARGHVLALYKNDADRLAIRRVNRIRSGYADSVRISRDISRDYLNALVAVHNATLLPATDTVTRLLNIHSYNPGLNSLIVMADSNLIWMANLRNNILPTRDYAIDNIMKAYHLEKVFYSGLLQPSMVVFKTDTNSNLAPLARKVKLFIGVNAAESEYLYGDGNDIRDSINANYIELVYSYGWQECPTGCEQRRFWRFRVYSDCSVEYMGSYGNPLEPSLELRVQENDSLFNDVKIYPNPIKNKLYVECTTQHPREMLLTVENKKGEIVYTLNKLGQRQEVDLILLSSGTYYLKLQDASQQKVFRIVKR